MLVIIYRYNESQWELLQFALKVGIIIQFNENNHICRYRLLTQFSMGKIAYFL